MNNTKSTRYRKVITKNVMINYTEIVVDTLPNVEIVAPITGILDGQNGSELFSIPGTYGDFQYGLSYVKETGEIKLYSTHTSISEKQLTLYVYYRELN